MSALLGFAAAVRDHGDAWRVHGACEHWKAGRDQAGHAVFRADAAVDDDRRDFHLMRDFLPGRMYANRPRAWGGLPE